MKCDKNKTERVKQTKRQEEDVKADLRQEITRMKDEMEILRLELEETRRSRIEVETSLQIRNTEKQRSELKKKEEERIKLLEEQIKVKEKALEASSKMFIGNEKDLNKRIEELENNREIGESLQCPEATALQNREFFSSNKSDDDLGDLVKEAASLREQNGLMEMELKEMQERYSEISLRFAEVEGERQLVMTVRNLKNAKRS